MPKYYVWTIGCQMNKAESEQISNCLEQLGYQATAIAEAADLIVLNSCVVRQSAEQRVISKLDYLRGVKRSRPNLSLSLTGCLVDSMTDELRERFPHVDLFFKPGAYADLLQWIEGQGMPIPHREEILPLPLHPSPSTFVSIIQGCNNFCSYCIVPYRRGREKSRSVEEIVSEVRELVRQGTKEVTLLGQNVDSYGHDLPGKPELADLLAELNSIEGLARVRFLTNHPNDVNQRLIDAMATLEKVCEHISLPVQSGDNDILRAMRRGYTAEEYRALVESIRQKVLGVALSTDVIVGFPGESEEQFEHTYDLLRDLRFDTVHVAAYSPRPGTLASRTLPDSVPPMEKKRRLKKVEELQETIAAEINSQLLGRTVEILAEGKKKGKWQGRTRTNKLVFFSDDADYLGQLVEVEVERTSPWALQGRVAGGTGPSFIGDDIDILVYEAVYYRDRKGQKPL